MAPKKGGLGRGLSSLFEDTSIISEPVSIKKAEEPSKKQIPNISSKKEEASISEKVIFVKLNDIKPNSAQPRKVFDEELISELAASIKENGVIQPIVLRPAKKGYELVAGERRWRAARKAGLDSIPAIVRDIDEKQNALYALIENVQREDLNIIEEALGIEQIIDQFDLTQEEASKAVGKSRAYVTNALRLLALPKEVQDMVSEKKLSAGHARAIAGLPNSKLQIEAATKAAKEGWSVRQIESYTGTQSLNKKKPRKFSKSKDIEIRQMEERLSQEVGTKVTIIGTQRKGKLEIEYYSTDELNRIIDILM